MRLCTLLLIVSTAAAAPLAAQSLSDVARKESERRQAVKEPGKSYSNKDLKAAPAPAAPDSSATSDQKDASPPASDGSAAAKAPADAAAGGKDSKAGAAQEPVHDQAYWSKRMAALREQVSRDVVYADALQSRINALTTDFVNRDDPVQRSQIASDRQHAVDELTRLKKGTEDDKKAITDLEEEARRAGVPPGWLR